MTNHIALKTKAKEVFDRNTWHLMLGYALAVALPTLIVGGSGAYSTWDTTSTSSLSSLNADAPEALIVLFILLAVLLMLSTFLIIILIGASLLSSLPMSAYQRMCLRAHDGVAVEVESLVDVKEYWSKLLWLNFWMGFKIFLWSLLFVIPGIVAMYRYALAPYILFENPGKSPAQCITESSMLMKGRKGALFTLDLSFILWGLLVVFTGGIATFFVTPYHTLTRAGFYREVVPKSDNTSASTDIMTAEMVADC
ncbi:MAG: DUF975 family protein [Coriobacteriia bacterium]|nr:DUF975 family protein [Coriobacteriia bacterium]